jgi:hypothetical protein
LERGIDVAALRKQQMLRVFYAGPVAPEISMISSTTRPRQWGSRRRIERLKEK